MLASAIFRGDEVVAVRSRQLGEGSIRIAIHAVGRMKSGPEKELAERYLDRVAKAGPAVGLEFAGLSETPESRAKSPAERKREEGRRLIELAEGSALVLLDERGNNLSSRDFGTRIASFRDSGMRQMVIAIGGPDGHDENLRGKADLSIAFGRKPGLISSFGSCSPSSCTA